MCAEPSKNINLVYVSCMTHTLIDVEESRISKEKALSVIFGTLLGDSYAERRGPSTRIHFSQESKNIAYLIYLWKLLKNAGYCSEKEPKIQTRLGKKGTIRYVCRFKSYSFSDFNWIHEAFYRPIETYNPAREARGACGNTKYIKVVPKNIANYLTPLALAVWIQDDGNKQGSGLKIATMCFSYEDNVSLCEVLKCKYNITVTVIRNGYKKDGSVAYCLYIHSHSMNDLRKIVKPRSPRDLRSRGYFVDSMLYKLK
jgi:ubiquinol-cytochrome c reductase cytochrome b subunit